MLQIGIGDSRIDQPAARWDVARWDDPAAAWSGLEPIWLDVSCEAFSFRCEYGRQRLTDRYVPGQASVVVRNLSGWADPSADVVPGELTMRPGRAIRVGVQHVTLGLRWLFRGFIDAMTPTYLPDDYDRVEFSCIDALGEVNRAKLSPVDPPIGASDTVAVRISRVLDGALWPTDKRDLTATGDTLIESDLGGQVADLLGQAADSGGGSVFGDLDANVVYRPRDWQTFAPGTPPDGTIGNVETGHTIPGTPQIDGYLAPAVGSVSTPDTSDMTIDGRVRLTFGLRLTSIGTGFPSLMTKALGGYPGLEMNVYAYQPSNNYVALSTANVALTANVDTVMAQPFPIGAADHTLGIEFAPRSTALTSTLDGVRTNRVAGTPLGLPDTTAPVKLGGSAQLPGRVYWAQLEAINRAQLVFPGVAGNYLSVPDAPNLHITDDIEIVARVSLTDWTPSGPNTIAYKSDFSYGTYINASGVLTFEFNGGSLVAGSNALGFADGTMVWLKVTRVRSSGLVSFYSAPDSPTEPTSWTARGTQIVGAGTAITTGTGDMRIGNVSTLPLKGRIARTIVRNGIAGTTVLDVNENDAGRMLTASTFVATSGQTVTVAQTAPNAIVQPQPDVVMWRFDANEYPGTGTSYVDPRGRTWTLSVAGVITPMIPAVPDTVIPPDVCPVQWERPFARADLATRVIIGRDTETAQVLDDDPGQVLYGIEPFERTDLLTERDDKITLLGERILRIRSAQAAPRIRSVSLDARTDPAALDLMATVDVFKPSRYRCRLHLDRGTVFDAEHFATAVVHEMTADAWTLALNLDLAAPFAAAGGRWDGALWDQATWAS